MNRLLKRVKPPAIVDPAAHAQSRFGKTFETVREQTVWEPYAAYRCTYEFEKMDGGYRRHCGPTAMVNLLQTFENRYPAAKKPDPPATSFRQIALLGIRKRYYMNADLLGGLFGGTWNLVLAKYLRIVLRRNHREDVRVSFAKPSWSRFLTDALDRGAVLYLALVFHPLYGNHHVIAYGCRHLRASDGTRKLYLLVADGWNPDKRWLLADDLIAGQFLEVAKTGADPVKEMSIRK